MTKLCIGALAAVTAFAIAVVAYALSTPMPDHKGESEISYVFIQSRLIQPGQSIEQEVALQGFGVSALEFPYRLDGARAARVRVMTADDAGHPLQNSVLTLAPTPETNSRLFYWEVTYWGPVAYYARVPVSLPAASRSLRVRVTVEPGSPPVALFANAVDGQGHLVKYPESGPPAGERVAMRTLYGDIRPAWIEWEVTARRMSAIGPPWLPYPAPVLLAIALVGLTAAACLVIVRSDPLPRPVAPEPRAEGGREPGG